MHDSQTNKQAVNLEDALSYLQCVLVARRNLYTPEAVTWAQYDVLEILRLQGAMTPSLLSNKLGAIRTGISKSLRVLKDLRLIEQKQGMDDHREQLTMLTDQGRDFLARAAAGRRDTAKCVMSQLTLGEQAIFAELCNKVSASLSMPTNLPEAES